jgi:hypothetical protein
MGYQVEEGKGLPLYGYQGDRRPQTADIVVRRKFISSASNDLGFRWVGDHFDAIISEYDVRLLGKDFTARLTRAYAYHKVKKEADRRGLAVVEEERLEDQTIRLVVRQWR